MDAINHPSHYNIGAIEVIDAIEDWQLDFCLGNAVKYIARAGKKDVDKTQEDLEKSIWYIQRVVLNLKRRNNLKHTLADKNPVNVLTDEQRMEFNDYWLKQAEKMNNATVQLSPWIKCSERLPDIYSHVFVSDGATLSKAMSRVDYEGNRFFVDLSTRRIINNITHWAPLSALPLPEE